MAIRVLLADDQALLRATFRVLIDSCDDMQVVGEATDGAEAVDLARIHHPDIVLMDIRMPVTDGLTATSTICSDSDLQDTRVLILTTFLTDEHVAQALRFGASGFLGKNATAEELIEGLRTVASGEALLSPGATRALITRFLDTPDPSQRPPLPKELDNLTAREREMVALVAQGKSDDEIAGEVCLSPLTVRTHVQRAKAKLDVRSRAQLVAAAYQLGLVKPGNADPGRQ